MKVEFSFPGWNCIDQKWFCSFCMSWFLTLQKVYNSSQTSPECIQTPCLHVGNTALSRHGRLYFLLSFPRDSLFEFSTTCLALVIYVISKIVMPNNITYIVWQQESRQGGSTHSLHASWNIDKRITTCQLWRSPTQQGEGHCASDPVGMPNNARREEKIKPNWVFDFITLIHLHCIHLIRQLRVTR